MTVKDIFEFLNRLYPIEDAAAFDNPGILVGNPLQEVRRVMIALDCTKQTVQTAVEEGCELIITHHPVIFTPLKQILSDSVVYALVQNNLSVVSMHTNLDVGKNGVNDILCKTVGLQNIRPYPVADGFILRCGTLSPIGAPAFAQKLKATLGGCVKYTDGQKPIEKVLVCSGSGGDYITDAINGGFDAMITSEVKHHQWIDATENRVSVFDAGHFNTEDIIIRPLQSLLQEEFKDIAFLTHHPDMLLFA